ncbi:MAG: hypothetical protein LIO54_09495 [Oscillospiraceae bacterium]|nr:hypothetical protein [Oscillospiraceae bacterium]
MTQIIDEVTRNQSQEVREKLEKDGYVLASAEYEALLQYTARKSRLNKKPDDYIPLLLEDEIGNYFFRNAINATTLLRRMALT